MERLRYLRLTGRQRVGIWLTLLVLALLAAAVSLLWHLKPVMTSMATAIKRQIFICVHACFVCMASSLIYKIRAGQWSA